MKNQTSNQNSDRNREGIATQRDTPFTGAGAENISGTSDISAPQNLTFQATADYQATDEETYIRMVEMFADKLVNISLAEWRLITLQDGRKGFALFFDSAVWDQDKIKKSLVRKEASK